MERKWFVDTLFIFYNQALSAAANILLKGAEKFRSRYFELSQTEQRIAGGRKSVSYHEGLMQLRKSWRQLGPNGILGDVSLRCIGSRAKEGGNFEVFESDVSKSEHGSLNDVVKVSHLFFILDLYIG